MKTIIKVVIAIALINGAARVGMAYANFYQLKDAAQELITFNSSKLSDVDLQNQVAAKATTLNLPLDPANIDVHRDGPKTTVTAAYTLPVEVFPNYKYPINFNLSVDALQMTGLGNTNDVAATKPR